MNTAIKIVIGILVLLALAGAWMYFSGTSGVPSSPADESSDTATVETSTEETSSLPPATGSLDELSAAVAADIANDTSLSAGGNDGDIVTSDSATITSVSEASNGSY